MAKSFPSETVEVSVEVLRQMQVRLEQLEHAERIRHEAEVNPRVKILDPAFEAFKAEASRSAAARTQDAADRQYGKDAPRWCVSLDSTTEEGRPGPNISEHPALVLSANSPEEAEGRYLRMTGIRRHEYRLRTEPASPAAA